MSEVKEGECGKTLECGGSCNLPKEHTGECSCPGDEMDYGDDYTAPGIRIRGSCPA